MRRIFFAAALGCALSVAPSVLAQTSIDRAKTLFAAGASAYASGQFDAAIQAFESANQLVPKPAIVFSIAQAHRRQYFLDKNADHLRSAVAKYHEYIDQVPEGGRRSDAAQALAELEPMLAKISDGAAVPSKPATKEPARLMIMTQTEGALVSLDGKPNKGAPLAAEVSVGKHHVKVTAKGFFDDERDVQSVDGTLIPVDVALREKPARIALHAPDNAQVTIDGRAVGTTPLGAPLEVPAGTHLITVARNGYSAHAEEIVLARDEHKDMTVPLESTRQRLLAYSMFIGAGAALVTGGVFSVLALSKQGDAQSVLDRRASGNITGTDADTYDSARQSRDSWNRASYVAYGIAGAAALTGLVLYAFDQPAAATAPHYTDQDAPKKAAPTTEPAEVSMVPLFSPGFVGGSFAARF